jgi:hypothetical protein
MRTISDATTSFDEVFIHEDDRETPALHLDPSYLNKKLGKAVPGIAAPLFKAPVKRVFVKPEKNNYRRIKDAHVFDLGGRRRPVA